MDDCFLMHAFSYREVGRVGHERDDVAVAELMLDAVPSNQSAINVGSVERQVLHVVPTFCEPNEAVLARDPRVNDNEVHRIDVLLRVLLP
jgi:hypothetical protein